MEWIKFDLHQHTRSELPTDRRQSASKYTHRKFYDLLKEQEVKLKAVTNHNVIDIIEHIKYYLICDKLGISFLPGVEIDYTFSGKPLHAISIINPKYDLIKFSSKLREIISKIPIEDNIEITTDDFADLHQNMEFIFIPHFIKTKGIKPGAESIEDSQDWVISMIQNGNSIPVIFENTQDYHKYTVMSILRDKIEEETLEYVPNYTGSDHKFDNDISRQKTSLDRVKYFMCAEPTYRGLEIAIRNYKTRITHDDDRVERSNYIDKLTFKTNDNFEASEPIVLSSGLNVIVGSSGSGKTLLLNEIYRSLTGDDLTDVKNRNTKSEKILKPAYSHLRGDGFINLKLKKQEKMQILEIPDIYQETLKYVNDHKILGSLFGISDFLSISKIIDKFLEESNNYQVAYKKEKSLSKNGLKTFDSLKNNVIFIENNKLSREQYHLNETIIDRNELEKLKNIQKEIESHFKNRETLEKQILNMGEIIDSEESKVLVDEIKQKISKMYTLLSVKNLETVKKIKVEDTNHRLYELINDAISKRVDLLGTREKQVRQRTLQYQTQIQNIISDIKELLKIESVKASLDLQYPYNEIQDLLSVENSTDIARYQLSFNQDYLNDVRLDESTLIDSTNIVTKLKRLKGTYNFNQSESIKKMIRDLDDSDLIMKNIVNDEPTLILELRLDNGQWKSVTEINPGTIGKISMKHHFGNIIKEEQPHVIIIDQPENDLDKDFISNILSEFIKEYKTVHQIILTSHDPILTINSDVNLIIESSISNNGKFKYNHYTLEQTLETGPSTDKVAKILDGSILNIKNRYQIYGGITKNGN